MLLTIQNSINNIQILLIDRQKKDIQTDRHTDRHTDRQTERQTDRQTDRQIYR